MTTEELGELFLVHLYDLAEAAPHPNFLFMVNDFASTMGISDREGLQKALDFLGDRGLIISAALDMWGGISAAITMEGSVFVEEGGETGIIAALPSGPSGIQERAACGASSGPGAAERGRGGQRRDTRRPAPHACGRGHPRRYRRGA